MTFVVRRFVVCLLCGLVGSLAWAAAAFGNDSPWLGGSGGGAFEGPLVVAGVQSLDGGEQVLAQERAKLASPEAVVAREESQTEFEGLDSEQAAAVAGEAFPATVDEPAGGPAKLASGERVISYPEDDVALVELPNGRQGVIASLTPMAVEVGSGGRVPVNLALSQTGNGFEPTASAVGVRIPRRLGDGVQLADDGVSLTPVGETGAPLGGSEGTVQGATVFYANTELDADTVVKPTGVGFEADTMLRSVDSPGQLSFRVGLPEGASLVGAASGSGVIQVVQDGVVVASVLPPSAWDASGIAVPASMAVSSANTLTLTVHHDAGTFRYPIEVDPTVVDKRKSLRGSNGNWEFTTDGPGGFCATEAEGETGWLGLFHCPGEHKGLERGQYGQLTYTTEGESRVNSFRAKTYTPINYVMATEMAIGNSSWEAGPIELPQSSEKTWHELSATGSNGNGALLEAIITAAKAEEPSEALMYGAEVGIVQEKGPSVAFDTSDEVVNGEQNALYGGRWASATTGKWGFKANATDPGLGISKEVWSSPNAPSWKYESLVGSCHGPVQCAESWSPKYSVKGSSSEQLPEGEDTVESKVEDPVGLTATISTKVKVDNAPPHGVTLSGLPGSHEIDDGQRVLLKASATSGLAGMASIALTMDGQEVGSRAKGCSPGSCTANGEWTLSGEAYAVGKYTLKVIATDNAGNITSEEYEVSIHHAADVAVGPGSVNPATGELSLNAADVSVSAPGAGLTVLRGYRSRHLAQGAEGPLGPQWTLSLGAQQSLWRNSAGAMVLTNSAGGQSVFVSKGAGQFTSPAGDAGLTLSEKIIEGKTKFLLSENGTVTTFALPTGSSGSVWEPSVSEGAYGTNVTTFAYRLEGGVIEPTQELAPVPAGVSCSPTLSKGCRALSFTYATETTATGEAPSEWRAYKGRLEKVSFTAYNPSPKAMETTTVAEYAYDKQGRLRAEWDPRISPALKTVYGYDAEGHVTAVGPPGQQPALFEQGTIQSDGAAGRLLAVSRPAASTPAELKEAMAQAAPANTSAPTLSSTKPAVGSKISVSSNGTWSNKPLAYSYQWQDCNSSGKECAAIPGAVNQAYYPLASDEGHTLVAQVVALNAAGSVTASSAATSAVAAGTPNTPLPEPPSVGSSSVVTLEYQVPMSGSGAPDQMGASEVAKWGQSDVPAEAMAVLAPDKPMGWPAKEYTRASITYLDSRDRTVNTAAPTGAISTAEYNAYNDVVRTLSPDNRATALAAGATSAEVSKALDNESTYEETGSEPGTKLLSTLGPLHTVALANGTQAEAREHTVYSYNEAAPSEGGPYRLVTKMTEGAQIAGKEESEVRTTTTSYSAENNLGWKLRKPTSVTVDPGGLKLTHSTFYDPKTGNVTETRMPAAGAPQEEQEYNFKLQFGTKGSEAGQLKEPQDIAVNSSGDEYVLDTGNSRIEEFSAKGVLVRAFGELGKENGRLKEPHGIALDSKGNVWVANTGDNSIVEFSGEGHYEREIWAAQEGPYGEEPPSAPQDVAVSAAGAVYVVEGTSRVREYYKSGGVYFQSRTVGTKGAGETQFSEPHGIAIGAEGNLYVSDTGNDRIDEWNLPVSLGEAAKHIRNFSKEGSANGQLKVPYGIATDSAGDVWVADSANNRIEEFNATGVFLAVFGKEGTAEGKLKGPKGIAIDPEGNAWVANTANNNVQEWTPYGTGYGSGTATAHATQTIYYTAGPNSKVAACGEHAEWANLPCQTQPAAQPEGALPKLQVTTYTYNMWDEPEKTTNTSATTTRTTTQAYDGAGRPKTTTISSSVGTALPTVTEEYNSESGAPERQSTTTEGKTKTITNVQNTLGQLASYTDADENTSSYEYDVDGRPVKVNTGKGTETDTYSKTTGLPTELLNEFGTTKLLFSAAYDIEGNMLTESYPNGMNANYSYSATGKPTSLEYKKTTHCSEKCTWFSDTVTPSIHGQVVSQTSTLSKQAYAFDAVGRLTQAQDTPAGKSCITRVYVYDVDTNRTSATTREPNAKGECATEGGVIEKHTYDTADRLNDAGMSYNAFGDITAVPAVDAGGKEPSEELSSAYYVDDQLASQTQSGQTIGYNLDPAGRTRELVWTGKKVSDVVNHYAGPAAAPTWTINSLSETTRNIPGIDGQLAAIQNNGEAAVLQLTNLHDDIIATAYLSETSTELASKIDTTEYGVPTTSLPPKYSWLGGIELPTELPSGTISMGARSYVPELGRFLQPDPVPGGSANAYSYTFGDPVNTTDASGTNALQGLGAGLAAQVASSALASEEVARRAAEEAAARVAAETAAIEARWAIDLAGGPQYADTGEQWEEEEWEEEDEYEYAAYHPGGQEGHEEARIEPALLLQPLTSKEADSGETVAIPSSAVPLCKVGSEGPCARDAGGFRGHCMNGRACKRRHHGGGGHGGTPEAKKQCPRGYWEIPVVHLCIAFEWPSGPSPAPGYGPNTYPYPPMAPEG